MDGNPLVTKAELLAEANAALADRQWRRACVTGEQFDWWVERRILPPRQDRLKGRGPGEGVVAQYVRAPTLQTLTILPYICLDIRSLNVATCAAWTFGAPIPWGTVQRAVTATYAQALERISFRSAMYGTQILRNPLAGRGTRKQRLVTGMIATMRGKSDPSAQAARYLRAHVEAITPRYGVRTKGQSLPLLLPAIQTGLNFPAATKAVESAREEDTEPLRPLLQQLLLAVWWFKEIWPLFVRSESGRVSTKIIRKQMYYGASAGIGALLNVRSSVPGLVSSLLDNVCPVIDTILAAQHMTLEDALTLVLKGRGKVAQLPK